MIWGTLGFMAAVYAALKYGFTVPLPQSVVLMYMGLAGAAVFMHLSSDQKRWERFLASATALLAESRTKYQRWTLGLVVTLYAGYLQYAGMLPSTAPPSALRTIHPTPPSEIEVRGKVVRLDDARNPYRGDSSKKEKALEEGRVIYFQNCFYCHGDHLDGNGHFGKGFMPRPLDFQDPGTIASITEPVVFWRVSKGGKGLPVESWPWNSAMPAWEEMLTEDQMWKVILYIYDATGKEPKSFGKHE